MRARALKFTNFGRVSKIDVRRRKITNGKRRPRIDYAIFYFNNDGGDDADVEDELEAMLDSAQTDVEKFEREYRNHKKREQDALNMKASDKARAATCENFRAISFDLQAILQVLREEVECLQFHWV